jgi:hypothetical protein
VTLNVFCWLSLGAGFILSVFAAAGGASTWFRFLAGSCVGAVPCVSFTRTMLDRLRAKKMEDRKKTKNEEEKTKNEEEKEKGKFNSCLGSNEHISGLEHIMSAFFVLSLLVYLVFVVVASQYKDSLSYSLDSALAGLICAAACGDLHAILDYHMRQKPKHALKKRAAETGKLVKAMKEKIAKEGNAESQALNHQHIPSATAGNYSNSSPDPAFMGNGKTKLEKKPEGKTTMTRPASEKRTRSCGSSRSPQMPHRRRAPERRAHSRRSSRSPQKSHRRSAASEQRAHSRRHGHAGVSDRIFKTASHIRNRNPPKAVHHRLENVDIHEPDEYKYDNR